MDREGGVLAYVPWRLNEGPVEFDGDGTGGMDGETAGANGLLELVLSG